MLHAMYLLAFHAFLRIGEITGLAPPLGNCLSVSDITCNINCKNLEEQVLGRD
jgi:hypothetical protein